MDIPVTYKYTKNDDFEAIYVGYPGRGVACSGYLFLNQPPSSLLHLFEVSVASTAYRKFLSISHTCEFRQ